jgi:hypothetical protein
MKIWKASTWLTTVPALLIAGTANANDYLCRVWHICWPNDPDPTPVSEPEMLALFSTGLIVAGVLALRRRRK